MSSVGDAAREALGADDGGEAAERAKQDALLDQIEARHRLDDAAWQAMLLTLAQVRRDCPGDLAWVGTRYLQCVLVRGQGMFTRRNAQLSLTDRPDAIVCRCGAQAPVEDDRRLEGRRARSARCAACGLHLAAFDDDPR